MIYKLIYLVGERLRNPLIRRYYKLLIKSDYYSIEQLHSIQLERLKKLLLHANKHVPFYRNSLDSIDINSITLDTLSIIPLLSREELRKNSQDIQNYIKHRNLVKSKSSGSTSKALLFERNLEWEAAHRAAQLRGYSWYNIYPWEKNLYFWGFSPTWKNLLKIRILDTLMNRKRIFSYKEADLKAVSEILPKFKYIEGYSSSIFILSQYLEKHNLKFNNINFIKGTSEKIFDFYQEPVEKVFNQKMISEYGAAETGIIAFECPEGNMHISMENMIVEEIDGKIYVTNLFSFSFPIIRYELGDQIILETDEVCKCGRQHHIIKEIIGRIGQVIQGKKESYPTATLSYISKSLVENHNLKIAYFAKQYRKGYINLDVICETKDKEVVQDCIYLEAKKYFKGDVIIEIEFISKIDRGDKKITYFESYIDEKNLKEARFND